MSLDNNAIDEFEIGAGGQARPVKAKHKLKKEKKEKKTKKEKKSKKAEKKKEKAELKLSDEESNNSER